MASPPIMRQRKSVRTCQYSDVALGDTVKGNVSTTLLAGIASCSVVVKKLGIVGVGTVGIGVRPW